MSNSQSFGIAKENYKILLAVSPDRLGYISMIGGGSKDPNEFNPEIFNNANRCSSGDLSLGL